MANKKGPKPSIVSLSGDIASLRNEVARLREAVSVPQKVSTVIDGPRRSEVAVDAVVIPMTGEFTRSGSRPVSLQPPNVDVDMILRGQIGTSTTFTIEINGVTKKETFVMTAEHVRRSFTYPFSDFNLG